MPEWGDGKLPPRLRHDPKELERVIQRQKDNTFGRRWFDEFLEAKEELAIAAKDAKDKAQRKALRQAARAVEEIAEAELDFEPIAGVIQAAARTDSVKQTIDLARHARDLVAAYQKYIDDQEDEREVEMLLSWH